MKPKMKFFLACCLIVTSGICNAQQTITYANFVQTDTSIKWAAIYNSYVNLTPANPNFSIRNFYMDKLRAGKVKAYNEDSIYLKLTSCNIDYRDVVDQLNYLPYDGGNTMNWKNNFDDHNDASDQIFDYDANTCDTCFYKNRIEFFKVKQLLYYKNNRLFIKNVLLSPVVYKKETKAYKEKTCYSSLMNVAADYSENENPIPTSAVFIKRTCNELKLSYNENDAKNTSRILTANNWNLFGILYAAARENKILFYPVELDPYPNPKKIIPYDSIGRVHNPIETIYKYDSLGQVIEMALVVKDISTDSFNQYKLIQDHYFDFEKEKLYSRIIALVIQKNFYLDKNSYVGLMDYWGIIFPKKLKSQKRHPIPSVQ